MTHTHNVTNVTLTGCICVALLLTLVPGAFLIGDSCVRTSAQNHSSPILEGDPGSIGANQRTRHQSERPQLTRTALLGALWCVCGRLVL